MLRGQTAHDNIRYLVTMDAFLPHSGGSRVYYSEIYQHLLEQFPDEVTILTSKVPEWQEYDRVHGSDRFHIHRCFEPLPDWRYHQWPKAIPRFVRETAAALARQYDCLHCGDLFPQALNGVGLSKLFSLPLLIYCHGDEISQTDQRLYQPRIRDFIYRHADAIVAANQFAYDRLLRIGISPERVHKLTPGVNLGEFHPRPIRRDLIYKYGLNGAKVLLTAARLVPRKGHRVVLRALPRVIEQLPSVKYLVAGEGPEQTNLMQLARDLGIQQAVLFLGDVPHSEISDLYSLCDVFAMINRLEPGGDVESFGMVFTEANAVGKPVVGGRSGGTAESVLDGITGFLVDPDDAQELAHKLLLLLQNDSLREQMGAAGRKRVIDEFSWKDRASALRQISSEIVARSSRRTRVSAIAARNRESGKVSFR